MKIKLRQIEQGRCPYCGSINVEYDFTEHHDDMMVSYKAHCMDCKKTFEEWYDLNFVGHNIGRNYDICVNPGDEGKEIEVDD